ncbi:LysE family translocator [uncultured Maritimibacter sp.]|jgi:threonine/homoserine/homoserine lactone efflux protein|uniref:LysE family translocator n=1 Tax=uncultured Maritimibacter sp. TaxID=991866 RepID=UPI002610018F|nr:LysE family translocator [uncultured Maritimibacter sp.]
MTFSELAPILVVWAVGVASPGPAILALISTGLGAGRRAALGVALGIMCGSAFSAISAGLGLGAVMMANAWSVEILRYAGAGYLLFLALKSARNALRPGAKALRPVTDPVSFARGWRKGALVHLTNPKAVFFWGSLYAVVLSPDAPVTDIVELGVGCMTVSALVVLGYAVAFSTPRIAGLYLSARRWFEGAFAGLFGFAAVSVLLTRAT